MPYFRRRTGLAAPLLEAAPALARA